MIIRNFKLLPTGIIGSSYLGARSLPTSPLVSKHIKQSTFSRALGPKMIEYGETLLKVPP